jgi:gliding motility-associated-like protein
MKNLIAKVFGVGIFIMCAPFYSVAEHITGGDFTVRHVEGNTFEATLSLYRDCASGGAPFDPSVNITVFDALTNEHLPNLDFIFNGFETIIPELGNTCFTPDVCLEIGVYQTEFTLPDNPNGYYLSKERCCRNELSLNLFGANLGFVFTVDVPDPSLMNSSPAFGEYPNEAYFCINGENTIDFGATDEDGDSLVYSFVEPYNGESSFFEPDPLIASSKPYSTIPWETGFSTDNQVGGTPPMTIDSETGVITAQPDQVGVFTVAVQVQEFRDGILIGTVRRELQLTSTVCVLDLPSVIDTPNGDTIFDILANTATCIPIVITDPNEGDTLFAQGGGDLLNGSVEPQANFPDADGFSTIEQEFCWTPVCENLLFNDSLYVVTITAFSEGCANEPLITEQDIYFNVYIEEDESTLLEQPMGGEVTIDLYDPSTHCFDFVFVDPNEADTLIVNPQSDIFDLENVTELTPEVDQGTLSLPFCWDVVCEDVRDEPYFIDFEVIATNCEVQDTVNFTVPIEVIVPPDEPATFVQPFDTIYWEYYSADTFCMPVTFVDPNFFDTLEVTATSEIFNLPGNPAVLDTLQGLIQLNGELCWVPRCADVREEPYLINFTGTSESCKTNESVEKTIVLYLNLPPETPPVFELPLPGLSIDHSIGDDPIVFNVIASDIDPYDTLTLSGQGAVFTDATNLASLEGFLISPESVFGEFSWVPDCPDVEVEPYLVTFSLVSESCQKRVTRTFDVPITVTTPTMGEIEPIQNIFTPNGDGLNEFWTIENQDDPCLLQFRSVVYDRWGKEVFVTNDPAFTWEGEYENGSEASDGQYFHTIEYFFKDTNRNYTGTVTISR